MALPVADGVVVRQVEFCCRLPPEALPSPFSRQLILHPLEGGGRFARLVAVGRERRGEGTLLLATNVYSLKLYKSEALFLIICIRNIRQWNVLASVYQLIFLVPV